MKVVILAGGIGTRLRPLTFSIPKPLIPIGERPILEVIISKLKMQGLTDIILSVGYKSELIKTYFGDGGRFGVNIQYYKEEEILGTAGSLRQIKEEFNISSPLLVMNGDIITKLDFNKMIDFHKKNNGDFTVGTIEDVLKSKFGVLELEGDKIKNVKEKPEIKQKVSGGIYVIEDSLIEFIPKNSFFTIPDLIKSCLTSGKDVLSYDINEFWLSIENLGDIANAQKKEDKWK